MSSRGGGSADMLFQEKCSDFVVVVEGGRVSIPVHSPIVAFHSRYFEEMLREGQCLLSFPSTLSFALRLFSPLFKGLDWNEAKTRRLELPEVSSEAMEALLAFVYTGEAEVKSARHTHALLVLAEDLAVEGLKESVGALMAETLVPEESLFRLVLCSLPGCSAFSSSLMQHSSLFCTQSVAMERGMNSLAEECMSLLVQNTQAAMGLQGKPSVDWLADLAAVSAEVVCILLFCSCFLNCCSPLLVFSCRRRR